ncbi:FAD-dependent thymidylate synthase [Rhizobium bangladeshense]|uniref:FAD-dependent thymidylate synthase n=1 Tax=Rhizobium bangladeshense TaxID=1138189 RepID=UPI001D5F988D|nr:FAD-dependent thymidylate synthase [Rhizobium bangladeshense]MBY3580485.1 FAD-dependent thymidylate synthase [Rhizobium bangladeshense]
MGREDTDELRTNPHETFRPVSEGLEQIIHTPIKVLDHGFIRVLDYMGDDAAVVQAARVSYGRGTKQVSEDRGLIRYLMRHSHTTPFEMAEIKIHVKLPIFVARQWIRHRTASVNEYSARYSVLDKEFYVPDAKDLAPQSSANKQGREKHAVEDPSWILQLLRDDAERSYSSYTKLLNQNESGETLDPNRTGLARELARMNLSLNYYTQWYWKTNLHNLLHFLRLRADSHAQYEIRVYAEKLLDITKLWVPLTYEAFQEYKLGAVTLSASALRVIKLMLAGKAVSQAESGLSQREWSELMESVGRKV